MRIKKILGTVGLVGNILNKKSTSKKDAYSCDYINNIIESGSNEKGSWIKYENGDLIQRMFVDKTLFYRTGNYQELQGIKWYRSESPNIIFPVPFIGKDYQEAFTVVYTYNANALSTRFYMPFCTTKKSDLIALQMISVQDFDEESGLMQTLQGVDIIVIGKWK